MTYTAEAMLRVAAEANVAKIMGENQSRTVILDVIPARGQVIVPRLDPEDDSLTPPAPAIDTLTFHLEDAMFGTVCYAAITCQGKVIVNPFVWESWEHLAKARIG